MSVDMDRRYAVRDRVYAREFGGEIVLLDLEGGSYFGLDAIGAEVWTRLSAGASPDEIVVELAPLYDVLPPTLSGDVERLVESLIASRLIYPREESR